TTSSAKASRSPLRQRATRCLSSSSTPTTREPGKGWDALSIWHDLEDLVEPGVLEDVLQMAGHAHEPELAARAQQALLGLQEHAQPRARDVLELAAVHSDGSLNLVEECLDCGGLRCVEAADDLDRAAGAQFNLQHRSPWFRSGPRGALPFQPFSGT